MWVCKWAFITYCTCTHYLTCFDVFLSCPVLTINLWLLIKIFVYTVTLIKVIKNELPLFCFFSTWSLSNYKHRCYYLWLIRALPSHLNKFHRVRYEGEGSCQREYNQSKHYRRKYIIQTEQNNEGTAIFERNRIEWKDFNFFLLMDKAVPHPNSLQ